MATSLHEVCSCGARFDYDSASQSGHDYGSEIRMDAAKAASAWRTEHRHESPPAPLEGHVEEGKTDG